jgi:hypothetical protein
VPRHLFQKGHKLAKGGRRPGAGRKSNKQKELEAWTEKVARDYLAKHAKRIMERYIKNAAGAKSAATTRHAVDKIIPPLEKVQHSGNVIFASNLQEETD